MEKRSNKLLLFVVCMVSLIITIYGVIYYKMNIDGMIEIILLSLQNTVKSFGFDPNVTPSEIFHGYSGSFSVAIGYYLYTVTLFIAPICTVTVIVKTAHKFITLHMKQFKYRKHENIIIFGYNDKVKTLIQDKNPDNNIVYHIFSDEDISSDLELIYIKKKVLLHHGNFVECAGEQLEKILTVNKIKNISKIILLEETGTKNIAIFFSLSSHTSLKDRQNISFYSYFVEDNMERIVKSLHDEKIKITLQLEKESKSEQDVVQDIQMLDVERMKLIQLFEKKPLHTCNVREENPYSLTESEKKNVHVLIVGENKLSKKAMMHVLNNAVLSSTNKITIDIVVENKTIEEKRFYNLLGDNYHSMEQINMFLDGEVFIHFHEEKILTKDLVNQIHHANPLTYVIVSTGNTDQNLAALFNVNEALVGAMVPIAVAVDDSIDIAKYFSENKLSYHDVITIPSDKDVWKLQIICDDELEKNQKEYHVLYNKIASNLETITMGYSYDIVSWENLIYEKKESNKFCNEHKEAKLEIIREIHSMKGTGTNDSIQFLKERLDGCLKNSALQLTAISEEVENVLVPPIGIKNILETIKNDEIIFELLAIEHRRWCYFMILNGWESVVGVKKNEALKKTPYLINFNDLMRADMEKESMVSCYDMIPYLKILQEM